MIRLESKKLTTIADAQERLQTAINLELATLPPYLYAKFSILPDTNAQASADLSAIVGEEMAHMCLACNILNAIGGSPKLKPLRYPSTMPGDIGEPDKPPLKVHLIGFSKEAMDQGMAIERPVEPIPVRVALVAAGEKPKTETIGEFYQKLDDFLSQLPPSDWQSSTNQLDDSQFFAGQIYPVIGYATAHRAISQIVSEGEGTPKVPLDFEDELAHYYRFWSLSKNQAITKDGHGGYIWGAPLGVDFDQSFHAICDPSAYDFSGEPKPVRDAQDACNDAYTRLIDGLEKTVNGQPERLGAAVRAMFDLRKSAMVALRTPMSNGKVAGPAFLYQPTNPGASE